MANSVDNPLLKPYWQSVKRLLCSR